MISLSMAYLLLWLPQQSATVPHPTLIKTLKPDTTFSIGTIEYKHNARGYRCAWKDTVDTVFIGDSFMYGYAVPEKDRLDAGFNSVNLGTPGWGMEQTFMNLKREFDKGLRFKTIVFLFCPNDIVDDTWLKTGRDKLSIHNSMVRSMYLKGWIVGEFDRVSVVYFTRDGIEKYADRISELLEPFGDDVGFYIMTTMIKSDIIGEVFSKRFEFVWLDGYEKPITQEDDKHWPVGLHRYANQKLRVILWEH